MAGGDVYLSVLNAIRNGGDLRSAWMQASSAGLYNRRRVEYLLYTKGEYTTQDGGTLEFSSDTPFTDMLEGK